VPKVSELFGPKVRGVTWRVLTICGVALTAHWAFLFWQAKVVKALPEVAMLDKAGKDGALVMALMWIMFGSIIGNFIAGGLAKLMGYKKTIFWMLLAYFASMFVTFQWTWDWQATKLLFFVIGACQGVFGLFTMCLRAAFPGASAHDWIRILLQHRADHRGQGERSFSGFIKRFRTCDPRCSWPASFLSQRRLSL